MLLFGALRDDGIFDRHGDRDGAGIVLQLRGFLRLRNIEREAGVLVHDGGDGNVAAVELDDGADKVQAETHTVFILTSRFIGLIKFLEHEGELIGLDAGAAVFDGDDDAVDAVRDVEGDVALGVCELDGVFDKVIDDLMQKVFIAVHLHGLQGIEPADVDLLFVDALFKREHGGEDGLGNIEIVWAELQLAVIDAGEI